MSRRTELLRIAAATLDDGCDPFSTAFLSEHGVTLDECYTLSEDLAVGARLLVRIIDELGEGGLVSIVAGHRLVDALLEPARPGTEVP